MLHSRRERLRRLAEREAAGDDFWTTEFSPEVRVKINHAYDDQLDSRRNETASKLARGLILRDEGMKFLQGANYPDYADLTTYLERCDSSMVPTVIEAMRLGLLHGQGARYGGFEEFESDVRTILREHRVKFDLSDGEIVPLDNFVMHSSVVEPALLLLGSADRFGKVNEAFRAALGEIAEGKAADAITDAATALQEMLTELGCAGNSLGPLIKSARSNGLLAPHDSPMLDAIEKVLNWVSADRSERGDSHKVSDVSIDDAWFVVHVVGAIIRRLGGEKLRQA